MPTEVPTEDLIRAALQAQAERAPHPGTVLEALRDNDFPRPPHRAALLVGAAAAVVVLAAVGIPLGLRLTDRPAATPTAPAISTTAPTTGATAEPGTPLRYRPGWLPAGYTEHSRSAGAAAEGRMWASTTHPQDEITLTYTPPVAEWADTAAVIAASPHPATVNGHAGEFSEPPSQTDRARLVWMPDPHTVLVVAVQGGADPVSTAQHVADSVVPDGVSAVADPIRLGQLPSGFTADADFDVTGDSPTRWTAETGASPADQSAPGLVVRFGTVPGPTSGSPVTVQGRPGWFDPQYLVEGSGHRPEVSVPLDGGWLEVSLVGGTEAQLLQVADTVRLSPPGPQSWIGR
jgi:hypothetical protein